MKLEIIFKVNYVFGPYPIHYISIWSPTLQLRQFEPYPFSTVSI